MSIPRKIAFTTLADPSGEKKGKTSRNALRFEINLAEPTKEESTEISYENLVYNSLKKKGNHENGVNGGTVGTVLDPYASDDEDQLKDLAKQFESKYGGPVKRRSRRKVEFVDKGAGYDEGDPFIDNSEAYDEFVPPNVTTAYGGFYINCGELEFKAVEFSESESSSEESSGEASGSESSSGESDSNSEEEITDKDRGVVVKSKRLQILSTDGSDSSRPVTPEVVTNGAEKKKEKPEVKKKKVEEPMLKQNGTADKVVRPVKPEALEKVEPPRKVVEVPSTKSDTEQPSKKQTVNPDSVFDTIESVVKAGSGTGSGLSAESKLQNGKHLPPKHQDPKPITQKPTTKNIDIPRPKSLKVAENGVNPSIKPGKSEKAPVIQPGKSEKVHSTTPVLTKSGSSTPVLTKGVPVTSLHKSGVSVPVIPVITVDGDPAAVKLAEKAASDESESEDESSSSSSESESEGEASETEGAATSIESEFKLSNAKLPENLPFELVSVITALKEKAEEVKGVKSKFFTDEVNAFLFRIELFSKQLKCSVRQDMYDYLTSFLPCKKLTLLKRARTSLADHLATRKNSLLSKLKSLVDRTLPGFLEAYGGDLSEIVEEDRAGILRKFMEAQEEAESLLSKIIFLKCHHFAMIRSRKDSPKEAILSFLASEVCMAFPPGFVSSDILYLETEASHLNLTSEKKLTTKEKNVDSLRLLSLLIKPTKPPKTVSPLPVPKSPTKKTTAAANMKQLTPQPKPLEGVRESKLAPNWDVVNEIEMRIIAESEFRTEGSKPVVAAVTQQRATERPKEERSEGLKRPRNESPENHKFHSESKRKNLEVLPENRPKPKVVSSQSLPRPEGGVRTPTSPGGAAFQRPFDRSPDVPKTTPKQRSPVAPPPKLPSDSPTSESFRASVVSVENMSELARRSGPKSKSPKPKIVKPPKEKRVEPKPVDVEVHVEPKPKIKPVFEQNMDSAKAVESLFAMMSPEYAHDHESEKSPETVLSDEDETVKFLPAPPSKMEKLDTKFESITPPETQNSPPETDKSDDPTPDLSWVFHEMSQISQKAGSDGKPDEKGEDQKMHDSFGKMFELAENVIKDTKSSKTKSEKRSNGNYSASFEKFLTTRSPTEAPEPPPVFSSKKHRAMKVHSNPTPVEPYPCSKPTSLVKGEQAYLDFLRSKAVSDTGACREPAETAPKSTSVYSGLPPQSSRTGDIPSYSASQYFNKQRESTSPGSYQGMSYPQKPRKDMESWGERNLRHLDATNIFQDQFYNPGGSTATASDKGQGSALTSRGQLPTYDMESLQTPLNFSRSPNIPPMTSAYPSRVQGFVPGMGYPGIEELPMQAYNPSHRVDALTNQLLYQQQQQRAAHYQEPPRSSHSGSGNYHHSSQR